MRYLFVLVCVLYVGSAGAEGFSFNFPESKAAADSCQRDIDALPCCLGVAEKHESTNEGLEDLMKIREEVAALKKQWSASGIVFNETHFATVVKCNGHYCKFSREQKGDQVTGDSNVFLDDLEEKEFSTFYGVPGKHGEANGKAFLLYDGVKPAHSLFIHPPGNGNAFVRYALNRGYKRFKAKVGLAVLGKPDGYRDSPKSSVSLVVFKVYGDDKLLWESKPMQAFGTWLDCDVSITGVNVLRLTTEALGSHGSAHATWIMPVLESVGNQKDEMQLKINFKQRFHAKDVITYHPNGQKKSEGNLKDNKKHGRWAWWYENGQKEREASYRNGQAEGLWVSWYPDGQKESEIYYKNGQYDGVTTLWRNNGLKKINEHWKDNKKDGLQTYWRKNGEKSEERFTNGEPDGLWTEWDQDGNKTLEVHYKDSKEVSRKEF